MTGVSGWGTATPTVKEALVFAGGQSCRQCGKTYRILYSPVSVPTPYGPGPNNTRIQTRLRWQSLGVPGSSYGLMLSHPVCPRNQPPQWSVFVMAASFLTFLRLLIGLARQPRSHGALQRHFCPRRRLPGNYRSRAAGPSQPLCRRASSLGNVQLACPASSI